MTYLKTPVVLLIGIFIIAGCFQFKFRKMISKEQLIKNHISQLKALIREKQKRLGIDDAKLWWEQYKQVIAGHHPDEPDYLELLEKHWHLVD